jgi:hypothetical protein
MLTTRKGKSTNEEMLVVGWIGMMALAVYQARAELLVAQDGLRQLGCVQIYYFRLSG